MVIGEVGDGSCSSELDLSKHVCSDHLVNKDESVYHTEIHFVISYQDFLWVFYTIIYIILLIRMIFLFKSHMPTFVKIMLEYSCGIFPFNLLFIRKLLT